MFTFFYFFFAPLIHFEFDHVDAVTVEYIKETLQRLKFIKETLQRFKSFQKLYNGRERKQGQ
jgi:hypothetical protein